MWLSKNFWLFYFTSWLLSSKRRSRFKDRWIYLDFWWLIASFPKAYIFIPMGKRSLRAAVIGPEVFGLSADYLFLDAKKYLSICSAGLGRSFGGRPDIMTSSSYTRPAPSRPLRATPRGCHTAPLPWLNLSYWKENKWHSNCLLPTSAASWFSSQGLALRTCQKSVRKSTTGADGPGGSSPVSHLTAAPIYYILVFGQLGEKGWRVSFHYNIHHLINLIFCDIL